MKEHGSNHNHLAISEEEYKHISAFQAIPKEIEEKAVLLYKKGLKIKEIVKACKDEYLGAHKEELIISWEKMYHLVENNAKKMELKT